MQWEKNAKGWGIFTTPSFSDGTKIGNFGGFV